PAAEARLVGRARHVDGHGDVAGAAVDLVVHAVVGDDRLAGATGQDSVPAGAADDRGRARAAGHGDVVGRAVVDHVHRARAAGEGDRARRIGTGLDVIGAGAAGEVSSAAAVVGEARVAGGQLDRRVG